MKAILLALGFLMVAGVFAAAPGRQLSGDYLMTVDGKDVDVVRVPMPENSIWNPLERQPYSYASFTATGTVEVCVRSGFIDLAKTVILPKSKGVAAISHSVDTVVFRMTPPMTLVLEPRGRHRALVVSANAPAAQVKVKGEGEGGGRVKSFGPGYHRAGEIALGDGETLYLAPGAWVEAASDYWANCAIYIQPANGQPMYDLVFEDLRFAECGSKDIFLNVKTMPITQGFEFPEPGRLKGLTVRNVHLPDSCGGMCVNLSARDAAHPIEGVRFEDVVGYGCIRKAGAVDYSNQTSK